MGCLCRSRPVRSCTSQSRKNMKKTISILVSGLMAAVALVSAAAGQEAAALPKHVKSATAVGEVFGDGEKISAAIIEYDREINQSKLSSSSFAVTGRTVTRVYANTAPAKAARGTNGKYVIIELSP